MPIRVFVYGGVSFRERFQLGNLPELPLSVFENYYGLRGGLPVFAFCLLDGQPFLLWRELQNEESRGGYPLTVLLDCGTEVYDSVGWNTAGLLSELFGAGKPARKLVEQPESVTPQEVEGWVKAAARCEARSSDISEEVAALWASSALTDEVVAVSHGALSCEGRPSPEFIAGIQQALPLFLRNGRGWLVGGEIVDGRDLGVHLVADDRCSETLQGLNPHLQRGREILSTFCRADKLTSPWIELVKSLLSMPAWHSIETLQRFQIAVEAIEKAKSDPSRLMLLANEFEMIESRSRWAEEICKFLLKDRRKLSSAESEFVLAQCFTGICKLDEDQFRVLDSQAVNDFLAQNEIPPKAPPATMRLARSVLIARWKSLIENSGDPATVLAAAAEQLDKVDPSLVDVAWNVTCQRKTPLSPWGKMQIREMSERLRGEIRARAKTSFRFSLEDYSQFGEDPDWTFLQQELLDENYDALVRRLVETGNIERLHSLALWPQRDRLALATIKRASAVGGKLWGHVAELESLVLGNIGEVDGVTERERVRLAANLVAILRIHSGTRYPSSPPDLTGILNCLGKLPLEAVQELEKLEPGFPSDAAADRWIAGLKRISPAKHDSELSRWIRQRARSHNSSLPPPSFVDRQHLVGILEDFLWKDISVNNEEQAAALERMFIAWEGRPELSTAVNGALAKASSADRKKITRRVSSNEQLKRLFDNFLDEKGKRDAHELVLRSILLGEDDEKLPQLETFVSMLRGAGQQMVSALLTNWLREEKTERRMLALQLGQSEPHLSALLKFTDEPLHCPMVEAVIDHAGLGSNASLKKVDASVRSIRELGAVAQVWAKVRLTTRVETPRPKYRLFKWLRK